MDDNMAPEQVSKEEIFAYLNDLPYLSDEKAKIIEEYFAVCNEEEIELVRTMYKKKMVLDSWTARSHGEAVLQGRIISALNQVERSETIEALLPRLKKWGEALKNLKLGQAWSNYVVGLDFPNKGEVVQIIRKGFEDLLPTSHIEFALPTPVTQRRLRGRKPLVSNTSPIVTSITINPNNISICIIGLPKDQPPPLLLLTPVRPGLVPKIKEIPPSSGGKNELILEFPGFVPDGYLITIEPIG